MLLAIIFTMRQLRQADRGKDFSSLLVLFEGVHGSEAYDVRKRVTALAGRPLSGLTAVEQNDARVTTDFFQRTGFLVRHKFVRKSTALDLYSGLIIEMWGYLETFVVDTRVAKSLQNYAQEFEWLKNEAIRFRQKRYS
ncbi:MAG: hypothetical protein DLM57_01975 [Pseudonocardiales bacterium]|nr:MAG: hypothetical protein DLM57_01975 [Pseudonocardiales bacterium]